MSTRGHLQKVASKAAASVPFDRVTSRRADFNAKVADAVLNAILPQITDPKQLLGVPENSLLVSETGHIFRVENAQAEEDFIEFPATAATEQDGPLTVVWMP